MKSKQKLLIERISDSSYPPKPFKQLPQKSKDFSLLTNQLSPKCQVQSTTSNSAFFNLDSSSLLIKPPFKEEKEISQNNSIAKKPQFKAAFISSKESPENKLSIQKIKSIPKALKITNVISKESLLPRKLAPPSGRQKKQMSVYSSSYHGNSDSKYLLNKHFDRLTTRIDKKFRDDKKPASTQKSRTLITELIIERVSMPESYRSPRYQNDITLINLTEFNASNTQGNYEPRLTSPKTSTRSIIKRFSNLQDKSCGRNTQPQYIETQESNNTNATGTGMAQISVSNGNQSEQFDISHQSSLIAGVEALSQKQSSTNSQNLAHQASDLLNSQTILGINRTLSFLKGKLQESKGPHHLRSKKRSQCDCSKQQYYDTSMCENCLIWIQIIKNKTRQNFDFQVIKKKYDQLNDREMVVDDENQIARDLFRTFQDIPYFSKDSDGYETLNRVLINLCKIDQSRGYIQGMNFIGACLLLHSDEVLTFYLIETLLKEYELNQVYGQEFLGLIKHFKIMEGLIQEKMPDLGDHLRLNQVEIEVFSSDWFISLFTSSIPLTKTTKLFTAFFKDSWVSIYKIILMILKYFKKKILQINEYGDILIALKSNEFFPQNQQSFDIKKSEIFWDQIFSLMDIKFGDVDEGFIQQIRIKYKIK
ncbi:tbc domain containing protein [Stylonychia lemnae]|uniref:Tbc domain containing protein n=1 Tax=Stylonychia lemnae TaxID=5949 RepID=A0A078BDZ7_STYLE|nr:tbc domain containing protein [Stylonychia lemnae]|eukprot:CDW91372.1 tbc domain containing protein [Stylonychia lemnae]